MGWAGTYVGWLPCVFALRPVPHGTRHQQVAVIILLRRRTAEWSHAPKSQVRHLGIMDH